MSTIFIIMFKNMSIGYSVYLEFLYLLINHLRIGIFKMFLQPYLDTIFIKFYIVTIHTFIFNNPFTYLRNHVNFPVLKQLVHPFFSQFLSDDVSDEDDSRED